MILFKSHNYNYYELGFFEQNNNFCIEYIIDEIRNDYKSNIINCFRSQSIGFIYKNIKSNENYVLNFENKNIGVFYKIGEYKEIQNNMNNENEQKNQSNKFILKILSILLSLNKSERYLINEVKQPSKNNISNNNCYLVNKNFILNFKKLFSSEIKEIIKSHILDSHSTIDENLLKKIDKKYLNSILNKKKDLEKLIQNNQLLQIEKLTYNNISKIIYPNNFYIVSKDSYHILLKICNLNENEINNKKYLLCFNSGKIILKSSNKNNNSNDYNFNFCGYNLDYTIVADDLFFVKKVVFQGCSYKKIDVIVCKYDNEGLSNNLRNQIRIDSERDSFYRNSLPRRIYSDYHFKRNRLIRYNPQKIVAKLVSFIIVKFRIERRLWVLKFQ